MSDRFVPTATVIGLDDYEFDVPFEMWVVFDQNGQELGSSAWITFMSRRNQHRS